MSVSVIEREFVVVVSCFEIVFCHADVNVHESECCCDSGFMDDVTCETFTMKRAKILFSAIALSQGQVTVAYFLIRQVRLRQLKAGVDLPHKISGLIKEKEREPGYFDLIKRQIKNT